MAGLYRIERTLMPNERTSRYDIINTLTLGNVVSAFSDYPNPPHRLVKRCEQLNSVWRMCHPVTAEGRQECMQAYLLGYRETNAKVKR